MSGGRLLIIGQCVCVRGGMCGAWMCVTMSIVHVWW